MSKKHNDTTFVGKLRMEVQEYERAQAEKERCGISWVQNMRGSIILNGVPHSGTAAHICNRQKHPGGEPCICKCRAHQINA